MNKQKITELLYKDKNYSKIQDILMNAYDSWSFNVLGKIALWEGRSVQAYEYFEKAGNKAGCACCKFLEGNIKEAEILLNRIKGSSSYADWLLFLIKLSEGAKVIPTYFQIRNFYEQDLEMLIKYNRHETVRKVTEKTDYIAKFNGEVYKYCARVLLNNGKIRESEIMLRKSLEVCFTDPETHYLAGELNIIKGNYREALYQFEAAAKVNGGYYPAEQRINRLKPAKNL